MYKIVLKRYDRYYDEEVVVEHTGSIKSQMEILFDAKNKNRHKDEISRRLVYDEHGVPTSASGRVVEEVKYK